MKDLDLLKKKIINEATSKGQASVEEAKAKVDARVNEMRPRLEERLESQRHLLKKKYHQAFERELQHLTNHSRNAKLAQKSDIIDRLFQEAHEQMVAWDGDMLVHFIEQILRKAQDGQYELIFGEQTSQKLSGDNRQTIQANFPQISILDQVDPQLDGFILRQAGIDYNFDFAELLADIKEHYAGQLANQMFA